MNEKLELAISKSYEVLGILKDTPEDNLYKRRSAIESTECAIKDMQEIEQEQTEQARKDAYNKAKQPLDIQYESIKTRFNAIYNETNILSEHGQMTDAIEAKIKAKYAWTEADDKAIQEYNEKVSAI